MSCVTIDLLNDDLMKNELRASFEKLHYAILRGHNTRTGIANILNARLYA